MCLPYKCSVNGMLAIDLNAQVEYTINNTDQKLQYNVNNIRNKTCWITPFWSCSWAMTEPISVKLHHCHCHRWPGRKGWEYMSMCWLLSESGGLTCCRCASIMSPSSIPSWIIIHQQLNKFSEMSEMSCCVWSVWCQALQMSKSNKMYQTVQMFRQFRHLSPDNSDISDS